MSHTQSNKIDFAECPSRVLVVDDDKLVRTLVSEYLRKEGFIVVEASNCLEAMEQLDSDVGFQFMVTDWELPDGSGIDLIKHVRQVVDGRYIYVIMITSHGSKDNVTMAINAGADDFLTKPIDRGELIARARSGQRILNLESRLSWMANYDSLTSLPTRRIFEEMVSKEWSRARRYRLPLSCVMFDIDFFKRINDLHGHLDGDEVLRVISDIFAKSVRTSDMICRYGGEEFCAVLPETSLAQATIWAETLRERIAETDIFLNSAAINVTASLGVAEALAEMEEFPDLIDLADQCLLKAKTDGRNCVVSVNNFSEPTSADATGYIGCVFRNATAADAMTPVVASLTPDQSAVQVSRYFLEYRIPSAPVVDDQGNLVGIVSEKDLMSIASQPNPVKIKVSDVMRKNLICYPPNVKLQVIWEFLNRVSIRTILIANEDHVVGILSRQNILRWLANTAWRDHSLHAEVIQDEPNPEENRMLHTASALADISGRLKSEVERVSADEAAGLVVGTATQMQELINDLLNSLGGERGGGAMRSGFDLFQNIDD